MNPFRSLGLLCKLIIIIIVVQNAGSLNCRQQSLLWHNHYRKIHQVGNVTWSFALLRKARAWAIHLADNNLFVHEKKDPGNLFLSAGKPKEPCARAVQLFYAEEKYYNYSTPEIFQGAAAHFTQVVWNNTKYIGAFSKVRKDKKTVVVVKYSPPGNVQGYFAKNVFPPRKPTAVPNPPPVTDVTTFDNATFSNVTTPGPKPNVRAAAMNVKDWLGAHLVMQWLLVEILIH